MMMKVRTPTSVKTACQQSRRRPAAPLRSAPDGRDGPSAAGDQPPPAAELRPFSDPAGTVIAGGRLPSTRRAVVGTLTAAAVALGGNLGGATSRILELDGGAAAARLRLDALFPVGGMLRCVDAARGFGFRYPSSWLGDLTLRRRAAERAERERPLDPPPLGAARRAGGGTGRGAGGGGGGGGYLDPVVAFGPAGSTGEENVSVVVGPIAPGFRLESLGSPEAAGRRFLETTVAPPGSGRTAELLSAEARRGPGGRQGGPAALYYRLEYTVSRGGGGGGGGGAAAEGEGGGGGKGGRGAPFSRRNVSVLVAREGADPGAWGSLLTFNAQCPEGAAWARDGEMLRAAADSFELM